MKEDDLWIKADLAVKVFTTLAEHRGTAMLSDLADKTIEITNKIFQGIQSEETGEVQE